MTISLKWVNGILGLAYLCLVVPLWGGYLNPSTAPVKNPLSAFIETLRHQSLEKAQVRTINLLMPADYEDLVVFLNGPHAADPQKLSTYAAYFRALTQVLPAPYSADAYAMLGFCLYHQKKTVEARESYMKSLELNPAFLSTYYNLAVIEFQAGNYGKSAELVSNMMALNPEISLRVIASSKIYSDIIRGRSRIDPSAEIKTTFGDAMRILVISQYRLGKFSEMINAARYAVGSGFGPAEVFEYYAALALMTDDQRHQAEASVKDGVYRGEDIAARFF